MTPEYVDASDLIQPDTRSEAKKWLDAEMDKRWTNEQGAEPYPILEAIALEVIEENQRLRAQIGQGEPDDAAAKERDRILSALKRHDWHSSNIWRYYYPSSTGDWVDLRELRKLLAQFPTAPQQKPNHWVVPEYGFLFPSEEAAKRYLSNIGSDAQPIACYTHPAPQQIGQGEPVATLTMFDMRSQTGTVDLVGDWKELRVGDPLYTNTAPQQIGQGVPDGWQLVPKKLTTSMLDAAAFSGIGYANLGAFRKAWAAALASAKPAPQIHDEDDACRCEPSDYVPEPGYDGDGSVEAMARRAAQAAAAQQGSLTDEHQQELDLTLMAAKLAPGGSVPVHCAAFIALCAAHNIGEKK